MKKNDIIEQKLFETCKLSEFYLNLVTNCTSEDESPMQLAQAYKQKLYEIVERYDLLLKDKSQQRQQLTLQLNSPKLSSFSSKTSTPNKSASALSTPIHSSNPLASSSSSAHVPSYSNCSSYASTPATTPGASSKNLFSSRTKHSIYSQSYQQHHYSNKHLQQYSYIYDDDEFDADEQSNEADDMSSDFNNKSKSQLELNAKSNDQDFDEHYDEEEDEENTENEETVLNQSHIIEKSYSNLSKDSGVFGDSYHSECSNQIIGIDSNKQSLTQSDDQNETSEDRVSDEDGNENFEENLMSPSSSSSSSSASPLSSSKTSTKDEDLSSFQSMHNLNGPKGEENQHKPDQENTSFIWGSITRLVENTSNMPNTDTYKITKRIAKPTKSLLKSSMENSLLKNSKLNKPMHHPTFRLNSSNQNRFNLDIDQQRDNMISMMVENESTYKQNNSNYSNFSMVPPSSNYIGKNNSMLLNSDCMIDSLNEDQFKEHETLNNKQSPFIFSYNSLMNVSMLDNIQATNTNLDIDNMNTSILMFN